MLASLRLGARFPLLLLAILVCGPAALLAQQDSVVVVAGARYRAGALQELLFGRSYRELWTTPVRVEVLDPTSFAGGLAPLRSGGGGSSKTLRLQGKDGRRYVFRTVDKDAIRALGHEFEGTPVAAIVQDQVSAKHPGAVLVVPPLLDAVGVLHVTPQLFVMPDHPFLGEFRAEYAGRLGSLEERPEDGEEEEVHPGFASAARVVGTERLLRYLDSGTQHRVDSRAYLTARLVDVLIGDWDRHADQWRWARFDGAEGTHLWRPIPRDRDNAFVSHDGLALRFVRASIPKLVQFQEKYPGIYGLTMNAGLLDRRLLSDLPQEVWDSVASTLQARITDEVIAAGIARLPEEYRSRSGAGLATKLRARRDHLPEAARRFYALLASDVDVHATSEPEVAQIDRLRDGRIEVRLYRLGEADATRSTQPFFQRTFHPEETREVRIHLAGGDDRVILRGEAERSIGVRVIGGAGNDVLDDSSRVRSGSGRVTLYDHLGENVVRGSAVRLDSRAYTPPTDEGAVPDVASFRDSGSMLAVFAPLAEWRSNIGPVVGGGPILIRYGFRREPYARRMAVRALVAPTLGRFGVEYSADVRRINSGMRLELLARATDIEVTRFHGLGNQTPRGAGDARYKIEEREFGVEPVLHAPVGSGVEIFAGPILRHTAPRVPADAPAAQLDIRGTQPFGQAGAQAGAVLDWRDSPTLPRQGMLLQISGAGYPAAWSDAEPFGRAFLAGSAYLTLPVRPAPTLALRAGGSRSWGDFPLQEASFVGGSGTLRGYPDQRFAGEAALFGGSELRMRVAPVKLLVRGDLGAFGLVDAARVYVGGESPGGWHTGVGGGLWISILEGRQVFSVAYAHGEEHRLYLRMGLGF